jgi:GNAT superfamily N-acetyltransferase
VLTRLRTATDDEAEFIVDMARHASVIEDWPLPDPDDDDVLSMLPAGDEVPIVAVDDAGAPVGAVWTFHHDPPLVRDDAGTSLPELCIAVAPEHRGRGIGGALLDALFERVAASHDAMCSNVHVRNPSRRLYARKGFREIGQGRGALGLALYKDLREGCGASEATGIEGCG